MALIGCRPDECAVFEDSLSGLQAGRAAGAGWIIAVDSDLDREKLLRVEGVSRVVSNFTGALADNEKK